jgi:uncharacterized Zn-binding protein involved in type VI secretion
LIESSTIFHSNRQSDQGSENVFINGIPVHREMDHWVTHCCGDNCHDSFLLKGSDTVFVNGKAIARIGDLVECGSLVAEGSPNVFSS